MLPDRSTEPTARSGVRLTSRSRTGRAGFRAACRSLGFSRHAALPVCQIYIRPASIWKLILDWAREHRETERATGRISS